MYDGKPHNTDYVVFFLLFTVLPLQKTQFLNLKSVRFTCFHCVYPCGVHAGMAEDIRKMNNILLNAVKRPRKKVPEIMRENLFRRHTCIRTQNLDHFPDVRAIQWYAAFRNKD